MAKMAGISRTVLNILQVTSEMGNTLQMNAEQVLQGQRLFVSSFVRQ
jgi:hypothetical protein